MWIADNRRGYGMDQMSDEQDFRGEWEWTVAAAARNADLPELTPAQWAQSEQMRQEAYSLRHTINTVLGLRVG